MQAYIALPHQAYFWLGGLGNARLPPHTYKRHADHLAMGSDSLE
jgi:hypothetical protein